jgi:class 3 adenylate cyclase
MAKVNLYTKKLDISFYHKNSEVNYDPTNKYYQATFNYEFEKEVYDFIDGFTSTLVSDDKFRDFGALPQDRSMTGLYFDALSDFNNTQWPKFNAWYYDKKEKLQQRIKNIIINAIKQQKDLKIDDLEFFAWNAVVTLIALISEEYFQRNFETLKIMKETLTMRLGEAFEILLMEIIRDEETDKTRVERTGYDRKKIDPVVNRYLLMYADAADMSNVEKLVFSRDRAVFVDRILVGKLAAMFDAVIDGSRRLKKNDNIKNIISDLGSIKLILSDKRDRKHFLSLISKDREFREKMVLKYEKSVIRRVLREIIADTGSSDLINFIKHDDVIDDIFYDKKVRNYAIKLLKAVGDKKSKDAAKYINFAADRVERSAKSLFGGLHPKELERVLNASMENFSLCQKTLNNFYAVRQKYGKKSAYSEEMLGIKMLRQSKFQAGKNPETGRDTIECAPVTTDQKTRIENLFEEGNLFYIREEGPIYPGKDGAARGKKLFMFADLRNSTETTMKLTKDTAGFLSPYLNTVYKVSVANGGNEIYFAGDGYAAHYAGVSECIRSAYLIHKDFALLRKEAEEKIKAKEKSLFKDLIKIGAIDTEMRAQNLMSIDHNAQPDDIRDFLTLMIKKPQIKIEEALHMVASEYSMPRVEIGIGITEGDLFFAVIGEENNVRFNIVLSPSLTQAARLSGSAAEVKEYLEKLYGIKNIPRKAYTQNRKLFNQGIVITQDVFNTLRNEVEVNMIEGKKVDLSYNIYYYYDTAMDKYVSLSKLEQPIALKGIENDIEVFEVFTPVTQVDSYVNSFLRKQQK